MNRFIHTLLASTTLAAYSTVPSLAAAGQRHGDLAHVAQAASANTALVATPIHPLCGASGVTHGASAPHRSSAPLDVPGVITPDGSMCATSLPLSSPPAPGETPLPDQREEQSAPPSSEPQPHGNDTPPPADDPAPPAQPPAPPSTKRPETPDSSGPDEPDASPTPEAPAPNTPDQEATEQPLPPADQDNAPDLERLPADPPPAAPPKQPEHPQASTPSEPAPEPEQPQIPNHSQQNPTPGEPKPAPESPIRQDPAPAFSQLDAQHASTAFNARFVTPAPEVKVDRIAGQTRIDTATKMYATARNKKVAVLSTGRSYADGLAGGALAGALQSGIILTNAKDDEPLEPEVLATFKASGTTTVYVTGGIHVIGTGVEDSLFRAGIEMKRLAGFNRFETADLVAEEVLKQVDKPGPVFIASGTNFPDALVASSAAARLGGTVRLVDEHNRYAGTGYCIGGPACAHAPNATKIIGQDRYETAYQLAARLPFSGNIIAVSGKNFPDALAAGALSAVTDATMVLTDGDQVGVPQGTKTVTMVGGAHAIKDQAAVKR